jgi:hypothetical protein
VSYNSLRRRGGSNQPADAHARRVPADLHEGSAVDFLRRHERESAGAARGPKAEKAALVAVLFKRASDSRNLKVALDHVAHGGGAAGPDGICPSELCPAARWTLARGLSRLIRSHAYAPGPERLVKIPKAVGRGHRTLRVQNVPDQAVQRAIVQVLQPFVDPTFLPTSLGSRPRKGREHALAKAEALAVANGFWVWDVEDVANAFDQVPLNRLLDVVRVHAPDDDFVSLVDVVIRNDAERGLRQGGALSPLLLNVYLDRVLDRPWGRAHPGLPLVRVVDDLLVLAADGDHVEKARESLTATLRSAGMPLKPSKGAIRDLRAGHRVEWLGYDLRKTAAGLEARLTERSWERLDEALAALHEGPDGPIRAVETIDGWVDQAGPCYAVGDVREVYARIGRMARAHAFEEIPGRYEIRDRWKRAYERWGRLRAGETGRLL